MEQASQCIRCGGHDDLKAHVLRIEERIGANEKNYLPVIQEFHRERDMNDSTKKEWGQRIGTAETVVAQLVETTKAMHKRLDSAEEKRKDSADILSTLHEDLSNHMIWEEEYNRNLGSSLMEIKSTLKTTKSVADETEHEVIWIKRISYVVGAVLLSYGVWLFTNVNNIENTVIERNAITQQNQMYYVKQLDTIQEQLKEVHNDIRSKRSEQSNN